MIMPTPDVVATVNGVKYRCESATVWWEIANPLTPPDRVIGFPRGDCRLQATEESGHVAALRNNRWSGDAPTSRSRPHL